jgi:hypothetical protein
MKSILFSLCWLDEPGRFERYQKWLKYHLSIQKQVGFDTIVLVDNASHINTLRKLCGKVIMYPQNYTIDDGNNENIRILRYSDHLPRSSHLSYPYCWRGIKTAQDLVLSNPDLEKIILLDSDCYICSQKMADFVKNHSAGWYAMWCELHSFPEAAFQIISRPSFDLLLNFPLPSYNHYDGQHMEEILPFTKVIKSFKGDRYGETNAEQTVDMDYYAQWHSGCKDIIWGLDQRASNQITKT